MANEDPINQKSRSNLNPVQIQKFLSGLDYPATKQDILRKAQEKGADESVMRVLQQISDRDYFSPIAISHEVGKLQ